MIICDLHTHSTASDGKFFPSEVVKKAYDKGVQYLALTDHDTLSGIEEAKETAEKLDMHFIPGVELSTNYKGETIHILGYFKNDDYKNADLNYFLEDLKLKRINRAHEIVKRLKEYTLLISLISLPYCITSLKITVRQELAPSKKRQSLNKL